MLHRHARNYGTQNLEVGARYDGRLGNVLRGLLPAALILNSEEINHSDLFCLDREIYIISYNYYQ